ncbi:competence protein CoiA family protein [Paracidovorax citrulli]|uniref:Competence protein n=2 Tax=Paracidovorax citrulli TaxID=80869 RepID=A1TMV0_PARC0|nr:competence protein CoiA family protein [Paracidovorax citrulli]ABM32288.1 hypothetical protein Aave_1701 [Paracidovorax citrulli AAC00-1]ATG94699.1 hypothetical protein CQB05_12220 [Paracidovorax citrulli]MVT30174.1 hypothetical protein [Paracidovorax citrulli]PVY66488.1 competence protein CoiA-like protein [Paracidovorax citrulli]QCX12163.1 hypothetical protein APS58_3404 [Paracidovorax citrulli]
MRYALVNGERAEPQPKLRGACRACSEEVTAKCGKHVVWHWSHLATTHCDPWWEPETQWHRDWKDCFPRDWQEVPAREPGTEELHIADVKTPHGLVVEFQHSTIHPDEVRARERFYGNMIWVVDGCRLPSDVVVFPSCVKDSAEDVHDFHWIGRSKLFQRWHTEKPVFMDFGRNGLWQVHRFNLSTRKGKLIWTPRSEFVEAVAGNTFDFSFEGGPAAK